MTTLPDISRLACRPMHMRDLALVSALDALCQPHPWGPANFQGELLRGAAGFAQVLTNPDGGLVGYVCAWTVVDELHIGNIGVDPVFRRQGLAQELMSDAHAWARGRGATLAHLEVRAGNTPAIALYERLGYRRVGVRRGYYGDNGEDAFLLVCDL